jgi:hypothetical protein
MGLRATRAAALCCCVPQVVWGGTCYSNPPTNASTDPWPAAGGGSPTGVFGNVEGVEVALSDASSLAMCKQYVENLKHAQRHVVSHVYADDSACTVTKVGLY